VRFIPCELADRRLKRIECDCTSRGFHGREPEQMTEQFEVLFFRHRSYLDAKSLKGVLHDFLLFQMDEATPKESLRLLRAFMKIKDRQIRA
jgi:hypothetical protein